MPHQHILEDVLMAQILVHCVDHLQNYLLLCHILIGFFKEYERTCGKVPQWMSKRFKGKFQYIKIDKNLEMSIQSEPVSYRKELTKQWQFH